MIEDLEALTVAPSATVRDAMRAIDQNTRGIALVVDSDNRLIGTITDGDIRRALLAEANMDRPVAEVMTEDPTVVAVDSSMVERRTLFREQQIQHLPAVDESGQLSGLFVYGEFEEKKYQKLTDDLPSTAVVMAGGLGTRLRPLTEDTPKPLIEVGGKPILERIVEHLAGAGVDQIYITTRYLAEQIEEYFEDGSEWGVQIRYLREEERLGTAGGLRQLAGEVDESFLVMNGDLLTDFDVAEMLRFHQERRAQATVGVRHYEMQVPYGVVDVEQAQVLSLDEKPMIDFFVNAGIYVLSQQVVERIPDGEYYDLTTLLDEILEKEEDVLSFPIVEQWLDIGRPEDLEEAEEVVDSSGSLHAS